MHTAKVEKRTYKSPGGGKRILTGVLLFVSCILILSGLLRDNTGGLRMEVKVTPTPTALGIAFDETFVKREIGIAARSWYAIQLGAFDNESSAQVQAETFAARGAAGYIFKESRFRVLAALYPTREDAQIVRQQLQSQHDIDSYIYEISLPELGLSAEGMAGQLDALEAGLQFMNTAIGRFCDISVSMDKQDLGMEQELTQLADIASQAQTLQTVLSQRFVSVKYQAVDRLISLLGDISKYTSAVAEASSRGMVAMAAQMKYQTLTLLLNVKDYLSSFNQ